VNKYILSEFTALTAGVGANPSARTEAVILPQPRIKQKTDYV